MHPFRTIVVLIACAVCMSGQPTQGAPSQIYAGKENPLVQSGVQRVWKGIAYPSWFQYPNIPIEIRQQLVDDYTSREIMASLERSANAAPAAKYTTAMQLIFDLLSAYGGDNGSIAAPPTKANIDRTFKENLLPKLVKPREGHELDSPSDNETASSNGSDYDLPSGDEIKLLDLEIAYLARKNNIPQGYIPPTERNFAGIWSVEMKTDSENANSTTQSITVRISQTGSKLTAIKTGGDGLNPVGSVNWEGSLDGTNGHGTKRMWTQWRGVTSYWTLPITITVEDSNTILINGSGRDRDGDRSTFSGTVRRSF